MIPPALEIGLRHPLHLREEQLAFNGDACRLLYISDIHLRNGRSERLSAQVIDAAARSAPDAILLGGDLVDRRAELGRLSHLVASLTGIAPVFAVGGNHDWRVGFDRVRDAVIDGGGQWIHDATARVAHRRRTIAISGPDAADDANADVRVLCAHNPRVWKASRHRGFDLVLAGHLHGCQVVVGRYRDRLYPGAIFFPYCYLTHRAGRAHLVVSRGVSDLVPIRWRCPREVVLCHV